MPTKNSVNRPVDNAIEKIGDRILTDPTLLFIQSGILFVLVWAFGAFVLTDNLASPIAVAQTTFAVIISGEWIEHLAATSQRVILAFIMTLIVGTFLGVIVGVSNFWRNALQDYITIGFAIPGLFAAIFAAMWFGLSNATPMVAATIVAYPYLAQNVYQAVDDVDQNLIEMSSAFGVSRTRVLHRVVTMSILPGWFAGVRYAFSISWKVTTIAELVAATNGIGFMIAYEIRLLNLEAVLAWTAIFMIVVVSLEYGVLQKIEHKVFDWREDTSMNTIG